MPLGSWQQKFFDGAPTGVAVLKAFSSKWVSYFGPPEVVLCDRGSEFANKEWREYVLKQLSATLVFSSPAYPQGNAINESSHRVLMHTISTRASVEPSVDIVDLVRDATMVFNAVPKVGDGALSFLCVNGARNAFAWFVSLYG